MKPNRSLFLKTFTSREVKGAAWPYFSAEKPVALEGTWKVTLQGHPAVARTFEQNPLTSWTEWGDSLDVFSGTGRYTLTFDWAGDDASDYLLSLGKVAESARVKLNGEDLGIWWSVPFQASVGAALRKGTNTLR